MRLSVRCLSMAMWSMVVLIVTCVVLAAPALAQTATGVTLPSGETMEVTGRNQSRGDGALILYDRRHGVSTGTNEYGVEVVAEPVKGKPGQYRVMNVTSVWACQQQAQLACGNAAIPEDGIVLSATGDKRLALKDLTPGQQVGVEEGWFGTSEMTVSAINPDVENNPAGRTYPGFRAGNQLLIYDADYGEPTTGTNEYGFEVTVQNGVVVAQEGSDSRIPADGYVVSGHGRARSWLLANAPIGAKMAILREPAPVPSPLPETDADTPAVPAAPKITLKSIVDIDTYRTQWTQKWNESPCSDVAANRKRGGLDAVCYEIFNQRHEAEALARQNQANAAANLLNQSIDKLDQRIWMAYDLFPKEAIRGAWHRPVETSAADIGKTLDRLQDAGLNAVFLETFFHGYTIFPSETYKAYGLPAENPKFGGVDLLKLWVAEAHKRGMTVHPWFQAFYAGTNAYLPPGPILAKYPEWANVQFVALQDKNPLKATYDKALEAQKQPKADKTAQTLVDTYQPDWVAPQKPVASNLETGAYFLDPVNPEVREFLEKLALEIATRYDVDGFQFDYIRYPASFPPDRFSYHKTTWGYTPEARAAFKAKTGIDPALIDPKDPAQAGDWKAWGDFKADQVSGFVARVSGVLRQKRPDLRISAAIFPDADAAYALKHQDWRRWALAGWVDFLAPMNLTSATKVVSENTEYMHDVTNGRVPVASGIFGPFNNNTASQVLAQMNAARRAGASGYVLFDTAHLTERMLEAMRMAQSPQPALPVVPGVSPDFECAACGSH